MGTDGDPRHYGNSEEKLAGEASGEKRPRLSKCILKRADPTKKSVLRKWKQPKVNGEETKGGVRVRFFEGDTEREQKEMQPSEPTPVSRRQRRRLVSHLLQRNVAQAAALQSRGLVDQQIGQPSSSSNSHSQFANYDKLTGLREEVGKEGGGASAGKASIEQVKLEMQSTQCARKKEDEQVGGKEVGTAGKRENTIGEVKEEAEKEENDLRQVGEHDVKEEVKENANLHAKEEMRQTLPMRHESMLSHEMVCKRKADSNSHSMQGEDGADGGVYRGVALIKEGKALVQDEMLDEAYEKYVRGLESLLQLDRRDPRVAEDVNEAEQLNEELEGNAGNQHETCSGRGRTSSCTRGGRRPYSNRQRCRQHHKHRPCNPGDEKHSPPLQNMSGEDIVVGENARKVCLQSHETEQIRRSRVCLIARKNII